MADNPMIRINKVVKEFNIGINTLVDFLKKKGIEVEASPNSKIPDEAYRMVQKEFGKEVLLKEQSKKIILKVKDITGANMKSQEELSVKTAAPTPAPEPAPAPVPVSEPEPAAAPAPAPVPEPAPEAAPAPAPAPESVSVPESAPATAAAPTPAPAPAPAPEPATPATPAQKTPEPAEAGPEPSAQDASPVLGHIDTDTLQKRSKAIKPKAKGKKPASPAAAKTPEAPASADTAAPASADTAAPDKTPEPKTAEVESIKHIATDIPKIAGPNITGAIDLSQFDKKKHTDKETKGAVRQQRGKRERIQKGHAKVDVNKVSKEHALGEANNVGKKGGRVSKKDRFKSIRPEVDEDAIQKQIKEIYARMVEGKGKTKGSKRRKEKREVASQRIIEEQERRELESNILKVTEFVTVNELATLMDVSVNKVIEACMNLGLLVSINQRLDAEAMVLVAEEFGFKVEFITAELHDAIQQEADDPKDLIERPPVVTVMGHVDHGKTSLLDYIRDTNVIAGEAGGITQHIGAYSVRLDNGRLITFLDTPGHEAFTAMRARGAKITDVAIIIIAADDAIMAQTTEAINHATAAGVPMIFAINKIDKSGANPERIREQLANMNILVEDWGGKYQCQEISAKKGTNIDKLLEKVLLEADLLELKANPKRKATGTIIESSLDKGRGYIATLLVQNGTLHAGDIMLSGSYTGRIKAMFNERGQKVTRAEPSTPVSILGLNGAPNAGEIFNVMDNEKEAREIASKREQLLRIQGLRTTKVITLEEIGRRIAIGNFQQLNLIVKGDVDGSVEALSDALIKLSTEEIQVNVIHKAVGAISESDVLLAAASNAIIIGFQVRPSSEARKMAEKEGIEIRLYSVIYDTINEVKSGIEGMLMPEKKETVTATVEVRETFKISKVGTIAGCMVKEGKIVRNAKVRVIREGIVIHTGVLGSLKRFKDDVKEVPSGYDCGLNIQTYNDIKVGDIIEAYEIVEIKRKL